MKTIISALSIIIIASCLSVQSQAPVVSNLSDLNTFMQSDFHYKDGIRARNKMIEGSPYLSENFTAGSIIYNNTYYKDLLLRYNVYEGHFEFKSKDDEVLYFDPVYTNVDTVWMGDDTYIFQEYSDSKNVKRSYMRLLYDGNGTQVLVLKQITLLRPEQPKAYEAAKPATFQKKADEVYIKTPDNVALEFKNKKSIANIFGQKADILKTYAKKNKLKFKSTEDIIQLCKYYGELD